MYYPELINIMKTRQVPREIINIFDTWLGNRDFTQKRGLKVSQLISKLNIEQDLAQVLLIEATYLGILEKKFILFCPFCGEFKRYDALDKIPLIIECYESEKEYQPSSYLRNISIVFDVKKDPVKKLVKI
ncbi:hypothetical protein [Bacillus sp. BF9-10]|uniref:hypothetical protein n=1 Tax=Bacillus sp. BF9-10 TaxID=2217822 RepID=UPI0011CC1194|nr:hypothetical protein [Bacillus sp. BF9-10]TXR78291.1 hypothetical protein DN396_19660 [Bacillus sp. BF9-10]